MDHITKGRPLDMKNSNANQSFREAFSFKRETSDYTMPSPETMRLENDELEPVAVIGSAARLPQDATNPESFWQMLCENRSGRTETPSDRFNINAFYHPDPDRIDAVSLHVFFRPARQLRVAQFS